MTRAELDLWRRWCDRRDESAFRALVAAHESFVYDFARCLVHHTADAEDLTQEAFLELAEADPGRPPAVGLRAFLGRRIVLGAKMLKRASLTRKRLEPKARPLAPAHPENAVENREAAEAALAELDPESRQALVLRFLHGLSYSEVAHVLDVKEGAARVRVHRGLARLKERFGPRAGASIAALVLFAPSRSFAASTAKAAVLLGGALVMSTIKKITIAVVAVLLLGSSAALWRANRQPSDAPARSDSVRSPDATLHVTGSAPDSADANVASPRNSADRVLVRAVTQDGRPVAGATIVGEQAGVRTTAATGAGGVCEFDVVAGSPYLNLHGEADGFPFQYLDSVRLDRRSTTVVLRPARALSGRVVGSQDQPVSGAIVILEYLQADQSILRKSTTDVDGAFKFEQLPPSASARVRVTISANHATEGGALRAFVPIASDGDVRIDLRLESCITVTGLVKSPSGSGVADASVSVLYFGVRGETPRSPFLGPTRTDGQGAFEIASVPFSVLARGMSRLIVSSGDRFTEVGLREPKGAKLRVEVTLSDAASVSGQMRYEDGDPLVGAGLARVSRPAPLDSRK